MPRPNGRIISAKPMPRSRWIRLVSQTWITKPMTDVVHLHAGRGRR